MLADQTRLRALFLMQNQNELCFASWLRLDLSQPKISRHLGALRDAGLLLSRCDAQWVFYQINKAMPDWQKQVLAAALCGIKNEAVLGQNEKPAKSKRQNRRKAGVEIKVEKVTDMAKIIGYGVISTWGVAHSASVPSAKDVQGWLSRAN